MIQLGHYVYLVPFRGRGDNESVAILVPADIHRHVHRFAPFLRLIEAGISSAHRACELDSVLKLGCDVFLVQFQGRGDKPWPFSRVAPYLIFLSLMSCPPAISRIMPLTLPRH